MPNSIETLRELRGVFRDELEDALGPLALAQEALAGADEDARREAIAETFRIVHSLKGAARAVAWPSIERLCDVLEGRLSAAREGRGDADVLGDGRIALEAMRACVAHLDLDGTPDEAAIRDALRALRAGPLPAPAPAHPAAAPSAPEPQAEPSPPAAPTRPSIAAPRAPTSRPDGPMRRASDANMAAVRPSEETTRVTVGRLQQLLTATDGIVSRVNESSHDLFLDHVERLLHAVRDEAQVALPANSLAITNLNATLSAVATQRRVEHERRAVLTLASQQLLQKAKELRVQPMETLLAPIERAAMEAAEAVGRLVRVEMVGARIEADRRVLDGLRDPLIHIVRNAVDHGIESPEERIRAGKDPIGSIVLHATTRGSEVSLVVRDDGRGIAPQAAIEAARRRGLVVEDEENPLRLLFEPGVTTRTNVSALSGRGVGLDVVRERVARLQGRLELESVVGQGTSVVLNVPLDLSVTNMLLVRAGETLAAIASTSVQSVHRMDTLEVRTIQGRPFARTRNEIVRLADLSSTLQLHHGATRNESAPTACVFVAAGDRRVALTVQEVIESRDLIVHALPMRVQSVPFVSGVASVRDEEIVLVLDAGALVGLARHREMAEPEAPRRVPHVLVVDDSLTTRQLLRGILESAGYHVTTMSDGLAALHALTQAQPLHVDAIVSDIEMPALDGWQLLTRVRQIESMAKVPFIMVTSLAQEADQRRAASLGANAYVVKGRFDQVALLHALEQWVE